MPSVSQDHRFLALEIGQYGRTARRYNLLLQCERFGPRKDGARKEIEAIVNVVRDWLDHFHACGVVVHCLTQWQYFDAESNIHAVPMKKMAALRRLRPGAPSDPPRAANARRGVGDWPDA